MQDERKRKNMIEKKPLALYVHIPFCVKKCAYCDFLSAPASVEEKEHYVNLLCEEIEKEAVCYPDYRGTTVFFGGGTPTAMKPAQLDRILCKLKEGFFADGFQKAVQTGTGTAEEPEITLECNPGTVTKENLRQLQAAGFNRLSIGLQSANHKELRMLGRIHTWEDFLETYRFARETGFRNINVDLMSALPGQRVCDYVNSLEQVADLRPEHISAYSLIIEEGTPFFERYGEADRERKRDGADKRHLLPTEEEERQMYERTEEILGERGYHRYEISNYALPGCECRHNTVYWRRGDYLGFGPGAASLMGNCRFTKSREPEQYERNLREYHTVPKKNRVCINERRPVTENFHQNLQPLSLSDQMEEFMFLGLRMTEGISAEEFEKCFLVPVGDIYGGVLKKLEKQGLLVWDSNRIFLTKRGIDVSNMVLAEFLL